MFKVSNSSLRIFLGLPGAACGLMLPTANANIANIIDSTYGAGRAASKSAICECGGTPPQGPDIWELRLAIARRSQAGRWRTG